MRPGLTVPRCDKWYPPLPYASSAFAVVPPLLRESSIEGKRVDGPLAASTDYERRYPRWEVNTLYKRMQGIDNVADPLFPSSLLSLSLYPWKGVFEWSVILYFSTIYPATNLGESWAKSKSCDYFAGLKPYRIVVCDVYKFFENSEAISFPFNWNCFTIQSM